jgi:hypothetical protein
MDSSPGPFLSLFFFVPHLGPSRPQARNLNKFSYCGNEMCLQCVFKSLLHNFVLLLTDIHSPQFSAEKNGGDIPPLSHMSSWHNA